MLLLSALVLLPLVLELLAEDGEKARPAQLLGWIRVLQSPAASLLAWACSQPEGSWAALAAAPWLVVCGLAAATGWLRATKRGGGTSLGRLCGDTALVFLGVGGAWVLADRAGYQPLNFDRAIVALTAMHFHFAGLLLPTQAGLIVRVFPESRFAARAAVGTVLGVPAVAMGITATQLGFGPAFECAAGVGLALSGMAIAVLTVRLGTERVGSWIARGLFVIAGTSLFLGMILAGCYALRSVAMPLPWLGIPAVRALHGTLNALGFGLGNVLAWTLAANRSH